MLDLNKPLRTKAGEEVTLVATGVVEAIPGLNAAPPHRGQTVLVRFSHPKRSGWEYGYYSPEGRYLTFAPTRDDLENGPERRKTYVSLYDGFSTPEDAERDNREGSPVVELIFDGNDLVSSKVVREGRAGLECGRRA